mgnify:CR=1 FL=1
MSTMYVNNIAPLEGTTINVASGNTLSAPGHVIQVVQQAIYSGSSTSSTSYVSSGHSCQITPSSPSSKILARVSGGGGYTTAGNLGGANKLYRTIGSGTTAALTAQQQDWAIWNSGSPTIAPHSFEYLDSPNTTEQLTYAVYIRRDPNGASGEYHYSVNYFGGGRYPYVTLTLMEIAQ